MEFRKGRRGSRIERRAIVTVERQRERGPQRQRHNRDGYGKGIDIAEIEDGGPELFVYPASDRGSVLPSAAVIRQSSRSRIYSIGPPLKFTRVIPTPR